MIRTEITEENIIQSKLYNPWISSPPKTELEAEALKWFASLPPDAQLAQIMHMYEDRMRQNAEEMERVAG